MHKKAAFTMVELIFVIVILGILAAVAVPKLNASREDAKLVKYVTDVVTIMRDVRSYYAANGELVRRIVTQIPNEEECKKYALPSNQLIWQNGKCYGREHYNENSDPINHMTSVQLKESSSISYLYVGENQDQYTAPCLGFMAGYYRSDVPFTNLVVAQSYYTADANASGSSDEAICKRVLAHPAVQAALTNEQGSTVGVRWGLPAVVAGADHTEECTDKEQCRVVFLLGSSEVNWD